ncbi:MAG: UPF0158 family protein [Clostridiales bacterium]|nr:UPF0158 family protein [Clostridiales bacterium]
MKIKLQEVIDAIEQADDDWTGFYDTLTGETVWVGDPLMTGESYEELEALIDSSGNRFYRLPTKFDIHEYGIMRDFVDDLPAGALQNQLASAIRGRGAFRRFRNILSHYGMEQQWYDYRDEAYRQIAIRWCRDEGFEYEG